MNTSLCPGVNTVLQPCPGVVLISLSPGQTLFFHLCPGVNFKNYCPGVKSKMILICGGCMDINWNSPLVVPHWQVQF